MQAVAHYRLPAFCPSCGAVFASVLAIGGGSGVFRGNVQTCPRCGATARIADATFQTVAGEVLATVQAPGITRPMLIAFSAAVRRAYAEQTPPEVLAEEVEKINPAFGAVVRKSSHGGFYRMALLLIILAVIKACGETSKLDLNQLLDQVMHMSPAAVVATPEPHPSMEPRPDQPPP
jgi:hypothetical protein